MDNRKSLVSWVFKACCYSISRRRVLKLHHLKTFYFYTSLLKYMFMVKLLSDVNVYRALIRYLNSVNISSVYSHLQQRGSITPGWSRPLVSPPSNCEWDITFITNLILVSKYSIYLNTSNLRCIDSLLILVDFVVCFRTKTLITLSSVWLYNTQSQDCYKS